MQDEAEKLREQGLDVETVGDIIENGADGVLPPLNPFVPARLGNTPPRPEPGIYFGMSDADYHAIPALSSSGLKKLAASPMIFWASTPWLCEAKRKAQETAEEKAHEKFGKAYHCRIMEGASVFAQRYAPYLDPADFPDCIESTDQVKAAIGAHYFDVINEKTGEVKRTNHKPVSKVPDTMPDGSEYMRSAVKADWIEQLLDLDPDALVFSKIEQRHREEHQGKVFLTRDWMDELEIAALMVERDPEVKHAFKGGHAEVVLIWDCPETGVPMKARVDYLKIRAMVDLKSVANQRERSLEQAIRFEIANYKYTMQPAVYEEGSREVRKLVREQRNEAIFYYRQPGFTDQEWEQHCADIQAWTLRWAAHTAPDEWLWVFQQKGPAPITRGVFYPLAGTTHMVTKDIIRTMKRKFITFSEAFGTDPWLDVAPIYTIADEDIPQFATDY